MTAKRVVRRRETFTEIEIGFTLIVSEPGVTRAVAEQFVQEAIRYYAGACLGRVQGDVRFLEGNICD